MGYKFLKPITQQSGYHDNFVNYPLQNLVYNNLSNVDIPKVKLYTFSNLYSDISHLIYPYLYLSETIFNPNKQKIPKQLNIITGEIKSLPPIPYNQGLISYFFDGIFLWVGFMSGFYGYQNFATYKTTQENFDDLIEIFYQKPHINFNNIVYNNKSFHLRYQDNANPELVIKNWKSSSVLETISNFGNQNTNSYNCILDGFWYACLNYQSQRSIVKFNLNTYERTYHQPLGNGNFHYNLVSDGKYLWITNGSSYVYKFDKNFNLILSINLNNPLYYIFFDGKYVITYYSYNHNNIYFINVKNNSYFTKTTEGYFIGQLFSDGVFIYYNILNTNNVIEIWKEKIL